MTHTRARLVLLVAAVLGLAGDLLLRGGTPRLGLVAWVFLGIGAVLVLSREAPVTTERKLLLGGIALAALGLVVREDPELFALDLQSLLFMGALTLWQAGGRTLTRFEVVDTVRALVLTGLAVLVGAPETLRSTASPGNGDRSRAARLRALALGLLIAIPPFLVVAALLSEADPVFHRFWTLAADIISQRALNHLLLITLLAWLAAGWLRGVVDSSAGRELPAVPSPGVEFASIGITLYGLTTLLAIFLGLQARVLFGGAAYLAETSGLTVAEYARDGFFSLVAVSAVVLGTLFATHWLMDLKRPDAERHYRAAGWALVTLVVVLMFSAVARMALYVQNFGLSTDRFYATAVMAWVAIALVWFGRTVLRGWPARFAPGMLVATAGWVALLNVMSPEALIVRVNVARAVAGRPFDAEYHARLSADARPALFAAAATLRPADCALLREALSRNRPAGQAASRDWRGWSASFLRARALDPQRLACSPLPGG